MNESMSIEKVVGFEDGKLWFRVVVSFETVVRARELAVGGVGPSWRLRTDSITAVVETTDPSWFLDLDVKIRQARGNHSVR